MVKVEVCKLLAVIAAVYPRFEVDEFKQNVWLEMLQDVPYELAQVCVKKLILESPYPPAIADIRKQVAEISTPQSEKLDGATAWGEVTRAIGLYGFYGTEEALASMSPRTARIVRMIGWREICMSEELGVIRGQFLKMYEQVSAKERQELLLPEALKSQINALGARMELKMLEGGKREIG